MLTYELSLTLLLHAVYIWGKEANYNVGTKIKNSLSGQGKCSIQFVRWFKLKCVAFVLGRRNTQMQREKLPFWKRYRVEARSKIQPQPERLIFCGHIPVWSISIPSFKTQREFCGAICALQCSLYHRPSVITFNFKANFLSSGWRYSPVYSRGEYGQVANLFITLYNSLTRGSCQSYFDF